jgi:ABC-type branched-subunit amino acid transport system substrate-binding protein
VKALRSADFEDLIFGGPAMGRHPFAEAAGTAAESVIFPWPALLNSASPADSVPATPVADSDETLERPAGWAPASGADLDYAAASTYDAVCLTVDAIHRAGLNRARIREALRSTTGWPGLAGPIRWDPLGSNTRPPCLATIAGGRVRPLQAGDEQAEAAGP